MTESGFRPVIGHEAVIRHLQRAIRTDRVSHAYLLTGEAGSGRHMVAEAFAQALVCDTLKNALSGEDGRPLPADRDIDACGSCISCKKAAGGNHPDIIRVIHEKPGVISVQEIREQVVGTAEIRPYEGGRKIYIIPDAEKMNVQAQNALLKTIEEPPPYVVMILLSLTQEALLPTIQSRCVRLSLMPVPDRQIRQYLEETLRIPDYEARKLAAFAQGNLGRAREAALDPEAEARRNAAVGLMKAADRMDAARIAEAARTLKEEKDHITDILDMMLMFYRDVFLFKASGEDGNLIFRDEADAVRSQAERTDFRQLYRIFEALDRARVRLGANVNFELTMENLLMTLKGQAE